ncbi:NAD(P)/FAD-dependent oxidoreductase [Paenarthrobacter aurescens]|uniref:Putative flavin-containing monoamine oxidase AofH n=1 Tax=Paenarthrobacter aurescens TaxID=43663 RepID=A0A4Y3NII4_PAEAU|nr:NAD(P)/FAD-dependent oxidoreductase [Paenarthrobacter aurescens]MDO6145134.1 FAD-dependent oxidoreductase [Paenarthrobacter aurescens]MDO6148979.1 FAD-dependent oxidoreductase [Paenarthrobacter aurescens]MDO6160225.1 FAD-dependent oxidoreductase [Paenarthrobacter aurescens]MDO6164084.1 FAD-dependent oxidoreductase [Paenarthrobacter aurescens]GEB20285.1 putative flavin-containing monoamine oxidase AofH [Paenarthrobacter aurescens]
METSDVIVIGAGFAGLTAARELSRSGYGTILLEAKDRIAGRTHLDERLGRNLELGGTWVHWTQPYVWAEMGRYGIKALAGPEFTKAFWTVGGQRHEGTAESLLELLDGPNRMLLADSRRYFPMPWAPLENPDIADIDQLTLAEAIDQLGLPEDQRQLLRSFWTLNFNGRLDQAAYTQALRWCAVASGDWQLMFEACASFKIDGGTRRLAQAILDDSTAQLRLNQVVASIVQDGERVLVTTKAGKQYSARQLVLAIPLSTLNDIDVQPAFSPGKREAAARGQAGRGAKLWVKVEGHQERFVAFGPEAAALNFVQAEYIDQETTTLVCFGPDAGAVDTADVRAAQQHIDALVPGLKVLEVAGHNWVADEYARSTWPMHYTGFLTRYLAELQQPEGRIRLAGSDIANGWGGFIDGAIESGLDAARQTASALGNDAGLHLKARVAAV